MTETFPELLCSDAWWQRVAPALPPDGRALVKETLIKAAAKLDDKEKDKFAEALSALRAPSEQQRAWLRDVAAVPNSGEILDLSNILICHPDTGAPIDLESCHWPHVTFKGAVFVGKAHFWKAKFLGDTNFTNATFTGEAYFWGAKFAGEAIFEQATFNGEAIFFNATFTGKAFFQNVMFMGEACFWAATFMGGAYFLGATFTGKVNFMWARFTGEAQFGWARFTAEANFRQAMFTGEADFEGARFTGEANFEHTEFLGMTIFREARFTALATFHAARFAKTVSFRWSQWGAVPDFIGTAWKDGVAIADFEQLQTQLNKGMLDGSFPEWVGNFWKVLNSDQLSSEQKITVRKAISTLFAGSENIEISEDFLRKNISLKYGSRQNAIYAFQGELCDAMGENYPPVLRKGMLDWPDPSTSTGITDRLQALRKMARDADDRPRELDYFALELQARYQGKGLGVWFKRRLVGLYGCLSDYGRGVGRPLRGLVELCLLSMLCYWVLAGRGWRVWDNALLLSLLNALPPLGASSGARESSLKALYGSDIPSLVHGIAVGEGVIGLILLFLIALGLRNRFRL